MTEEEVNSGNMEQIDGEQHGRGILLKVGPSKTNYLTQLWKNMLAAPVETIWEWSSALTAAARSQGSLEKSSL